MRHWKKDPSAPCLHVRKQAVMRVIHQTVLAGPVLLVIAVSQSEMNWLHCRHALVGSWWRLPLISWVVT